MPINDARFKKNSPETTATLMEFLRPNFHVAYTLEELAAALAEREADISTEELEDMLTSLEYGGRIISKNVGGVTYYQFRKVIGFMPMKKFK